MKFARLAMLAVVLTIAAPSISISYTVAGLRDDRETVMLTFRPKPGSEAELAKVIASHWAAARRLDLVLPSGHLTLRADDEKGRPYFIDIFTWRGAAIPDHAPAEIQAIWGEMNRLTETREGIAGLVITPASIVAGS
jgi:hypothetical protein